MINVIGLGYIGLPTALMLASHGNEVVGSDINEKVIGKLKEGEISFKEKGIEELFERAVENGIHFSTEYQKTNTYIISVPTPYDTFSKKVDLKYVINAVKKVLEICEDETTIVIESTVSPGTIDKVIRPLIEDNRSLKKKIHLVHAPERIIPGNMIFELIHNDRTIGADAVVIGETVKKIYSTFCKGNIVVTNIKTAELTKVVENTYRAVNIAFANELAKICRYEEDIDVYEIIRICNMHPRVNILQPGPGVGGHCISVDPWFLVGDYPQLVALTEVAMKINSKMPEFVLNRIYSIMKENNIQSVDRVGLYGLSYKENVDDYREAPTLQLLDSQKQHLGNPLKVYDPLVQEDIVENQYYDFEKFLNDIDMVVIMVKHEQIIESQELLEGKIVLDCQNVCKLPDTYHL